MRGIRFKLIGAHIFGRLLAQNRVGLRLGWIIAGWTRWHKIEVNGGRYGANWDSIDYGRVGDAD